MPWLPRPGHDDDGRLPRVPRVDDHPGATLSDEFQDGVSAGSLVKARRCWLDLSATDELRSPQRFTFVFHCPTPRMSRGLAAFLRYTSYVRFVRLMPRGRGWRVAGTTRAGIWSLPGLEHLFMRLRGAGPRYDSTLVTLDLLPTPDALP